MAFKMKKAESKLKDEIAEKLRKAYGELQSEVDAFNDSFSLAKGKLEDAISIYNEELDDARSRLDDAICSYNEALDEARGFVKGIADQAENDSENKSDRWQEGDRCQSVKDWISTLREPNLEDISIELPADIDDDLPDDITIENIEDHSQLIDDLPEEPDA